jgi:hypothetical protein
MAPAGFGGQTVLFFYLKKIRTYPSWQMLKSAQTHRVKNILSTLRRQFGGSPPQVQVSPPQKTLVQKTIFPLN